MAAQTNALLKMPLGPRVQRPLETEIIMVHPATGAEGIPDQLSHIRTALTAVSDTLRVQTTMLQAIVDAATKPLDAKSPVAEALLALANATAENTKAVNQCERSMTALPERLQVMFKQEVEHAMAAL